MRIWFLSLLVLLSACATKRADSDRHTGSIDKEAIRRVIRNNLTEITGCFEKELEKNENLAGKAIMTWEIDDQGNAAKARASEDPSVTLKNKNVSSCLASIINGAKFPPAPPKAHITVKFPFLFKK